MMSKTRYVAAGAVLLLLWSGVSAFALTVTVNDQPLPAYPPAVERGGRVLLPMRTVFESLGATVQWLAATQTVTAVRGDRTVQMTIGQRTASVDGQPVTLDVPAQLIRGVTYVPVRFPAEALGADVRWYAPQQLVSITLAEPTLPPPGPPPPPTRAGVTEGVITGLSPTTLALRVGTATEEYTITPGTRIFLQGRRAALSELEVGEAVRVEYDARGLATAVRASYGTLAGTIQSIRGRRIVLDTYGQPLVIEPEAVITSPTGETLTLRDLEVGDQVVVRLTPETNRVFGLALGPAGPQQTLTITHSASEPLVPGETLTVTARGPRGATAWFDLGAWQRNLPLQEVRPGVYEGSFLIPRQAAPRNVPIVVHLRTPQGVQLQATAVTPLRIVLAGNRPRIISPAPGERVGRQVVVEGYVEPLSEVHVTIDWRGRVRGTEERGRVATRTVTADEQGYFRTGSIALPLPAGIPERNVDYSLSVASRGASGVLSPPLRVAFNP